MSALTENFNLIKPALTDAADITSTNVNWDIIDEQLKNLNNPVTVQKGGLVVDDDTTTNDKSVALANLQTIGLNMYSKTTATFDGLGWDSQDDGTYKQTLIVNGVNASSNVIIAPQPDFIKTYELMNCRAISIGSNEITFSCTNPQDVNVVVGIIIMGVTGATNGTIFNSNTIMTQIKKGFYLGVAAKSKTLTFSFVPKLVTVSSSDGKYVTTLVNGTTKSYVSYRNTGETDNNRQITVTWSGNSVSWDSSESSYGWSLQGADTTYHYVAIG